MDIIFAENNEITNFREIHMGSISKDILYRGSYPIFKIDHERDETYNKFVHEAKISCIINLADNNCGLERIAHLVPWYNELLKNNNVIGLDIQFDFDFSNQKETKIFQYKLKESLLFMIKHNGPYLIHCNAGIDRTGFLSAILEALLGATIDEILYDYLLSYGKAFADDKNSELNINTGKIILDQLDTITHENLNNIERYFLESINLSEKELAMLKYILAKL